MQDDAKRYWVGFNLVKGIGAARMRLLLDAFGSAQAAWQAAPAELEAAGLQGRLVEAMQQVRSSGRMEQAWQNIQQNEIGVLTWEDEDYPRRLAEIDQPPPVLYLRGQIDPADAWAIAIVGTRRASAYGRQVSEGLAAALAQGGATIVSGLARGVDILAHQAALHSGGRTLAVLGSGVDQVYPPEHSRIAAQIAENGALISDYPPSTPPDAGNFPPRNRIISGLSQAVVVVEASEKSGALITASFAAEQGRPVFAVPGSIYAPQSKGTNRLIQQGARPVLQASDVLAALNFAQIEQQRAARAVLPADATETRLVALLGREPLHVDEIRLNAELPIEQVSAALAMMELKGMVRQVGAMRYVAVYDQEAEYQAIRNP
jgi:DNA processing protein